MRFGPLDKFSSFPFENYLQQLKRRIRRSNNPLAKLVKRLNESSNVWANNGLQSLPKSVILKKEHIVKDHLFLIKRAMKENNIK